MRFILSVIENQIKNNSLNYQYRSMNELRRAAA